MQLSRRFSRYRENSNIHRSQYLLMLAVARGRAMKLWRDFLMKSVLIVATLAVAMGVSMSGAQAAATMGKGPTDMQIYCSFVPWTAKCATPAKAVVMKPMVKTVAMVKPVAAKAATMGMKMMSCVPAAKGKAYLYECVWK
jgi:hypothetical protein